MRYLLAPALAVLRLGTGPATTTHAQGSTSTPAPIAAAPPSPAGIPQTTGLPAAEAPAWTDISPARGPAAREDHTWTVDGDGRFAYLIGSSIAPDGRRPGDRCLHDRFTSATGELVLYGGQDYATASFGDLWVTRADGRWQRRDDPRSGARRPYAVAEAGPEAWVFGGLGADNEPLGDLWRIDRETLEPERVSV